MLAPRHGIQSAHGHRTVVPVASDTVTAAIIADGAITGLSPNEDSRTRLALPVARDAAAARTLDHLPVRPIASPLNSGSTGCLSSEQHSSQAESLIRVAQALGSSPTIASLQHSPGRSWQRDERFRQTSDVALQVEREATFMEYDSTIHAVKTDETPRLASPTRYGPLGSARLPDLASVDENDAPTQPKTQMNRKNGDSHQLEHSFAPFLDEREQSMLQHRVMRSSASTPSPSRQPSIHRRHASMESVVDIASPSEQRVAASPTSSWFTALTSAARFLFSLARDALIPPPLDPDRLADFSLISLSRRVRVVGTATRIVAIGAVAYSLVCVFVTPTDVLRACVAVTMAVIVVFFVVYVVSCGVPCSIVLQCNPVTDHFCLCFFVRFSFNSDGFSRFDPLSSHTQPLALRIFVTLALSRFFACRSWAEY
jgi:hypothetical protein